MRRRPWHLYYLYCCIWRHSNDSVTALNCSTSQGCSLRVGVCSVGFAGGVVIEGGAITWEDASEGLGSLMSQGCSLRCAQFSVGRSIELAVYSRAGHMAGGYGPWQFGTCKHVHDVSDGLDCSTSQGCSVNIVVCSVGFVRVCRLYTRAGLKLTRRVGRQNPCTRSMQRVHHDHEGWTATRASVVH